MLVGIKQKNCVHYSSNKFDSVIVSKFRQEPFLTVTTCHQKLRYGSIERQKK